MGDVEKGRARAVQRAHETIRFVRNVVLWPLVVWLGLSTAIALRALLDLQSAVDDQVLLIAALAAMTAAGAAGIVLIFHRPFAIVASLAVMQALATAARWTTHLETGSAPPWIATFWLLLLLLSTLRLASVRRLYREHPGDQLARKMQGLSASRAHRASLLDLTVEDIRAHTLRKASLVAMACLALIGVAGLAVHTQRLPALETPVAAFVEAWNTSDLEALSSLLPEHDRTHRLADIVQLMENRGWLGDHPRIVDAAFRSDALEAPIDVRFPLEDGRHLNVTWAVTDDHWSVENLVFPRR